MNGNVLYLLPVWLGDAGGPEHMPARNAAVALRTRHFFCEHERTARQMLRRYVPGLDLNAVMLHRLDKDSTEADLDAMIGVLAHSDGAIVSEAGMPCIADPGARLVARAHAAGIRVEALTGPSSLLLALAASGLNGQRFAFHGYLPRDPAQRRQALRDLEQRAQREGGAQLFIETPYRNDALLADTLGTCQPRTRLCLALDIDQPGGSVVTRSIAEWRTAPPSLGKRPCVFILG